jgi:hypothetical protein
MIPDNLPAFPSGDKAAHPTSTFEAGMTLRDWFAGQALAMSTPDSPKNLAEWAYAVADAMLAKRERSK